MVTLKRSALALGLLAGGVSAVAAPLTGEIGWVGTFRAENAAGTPVSLATATQIDFAPLDGGSGSIIVLSSSGDIEAAGIGAGDTGTALDFVFNPFAPINDFLVTAGGPPTFMLDLDTLTINTQNATTLSLIGLATLELTGFDATPGTYALSFQNNAGGVTPANFTLTFSANASTAVPEPTTLALLGGALLGLAGVGRTTRRRG